MAARRFRRTTARDGLMALAFLAPGATPLEDALARLREAARERRHRDLLTAGAAGVPFEEQHVGPNQEDAAGRKAARPECQTPSDHRRRAAR
jgi:hypothetical protein